MKYVYIIIIIAGLFDAVMMQFICVALPRDALVGSILAKNQDKWSINVDNSLQTHLNQNEIKPQLIKALQYRRKAVNDVYSESFHRGIILTVLGLIGLLREVYWTRKFRQSNRVAGSV